MTGMRARTPSIPLGLEKLYRQYLGERERITNPPKRLRRLEADRVADDANAQARANRLIEIDEALPHIAYVLRIYKPDWSEADVRPIRPKAEWSALPTNGWTAAAVDVLRQADEPLSIAEIVSIVGDQNDLDLTTVAARQKAHTSVNNGIKRSFGHLLERFPGTPERFGLKRRNV